jgi:hypothetical protein
MFKLIDVSCKSLFRMQVSVGESRREMKDLPVSSFIEIKDPEGSTKPMSQRRRISRSSLEVLVMKGNEGGSWLSNGKDCSSK